MIILKFRFDLNHCKCGEREIEAGQGGTHEKINPKLNEKIQGLAMQELGVGRSIKANTPEAPKQQPTEMRMQKIKLEDRMMG